MATQHTPGPWKSKKGWADTCLGIDTAIFDITEATGKDAGHIASTISATAVDKANALLIAAAPDLLAALEDWLHNIEGLEGRSDHVDTARAAVKKARGA